MKLVKVTWYDITAQLHTEENIMPVKAYSVGWIESNTKKYLRLFTSYYEDGCSLKDKIVIPKGCIDKVEEL